MTPMRPAALPDLTGLTILVVEDNFDALNLIRAILDTAGAHPLLATPARPPRAPPRSDQSAIRFSGGSPREIRLMLSAMSRARAASIPSVQPDTCGVISTFGSSWKG